MSLLGDFIEDATVDSPVDSSIDEGLREATRDVLGSLTAREAKRRHVEEEHDGLGVLTTGLRSLVSGSTTWWNSCV